MKKKKNNKKKTHTLAWPRFFGGLGEGGGDASHGGVRGWSLWHVGHKQRGRTILGRRIPVRAPSAGTAGPGCGKRSGGGKGGGRGGGREAETRGAAGHVRALGDACAAARPHSVCGSPRARGLI